MIDLRLPNGAPIQVDQLRCAAGHLRVGDFGLWNRRRICNEMPGHHLVFQSNTGFAACHGQHGQVALGKPKQQSNIPRGHVFSQLRQVEIA